MFSNASFIKNYKPDNASSIVEVFYNNLISKEDQKLFDIAFAPKVEQAELDEFFKEWDIEKYGERKSMMLSYLMKANRQLQFSEYAKPRLEGLLKYHRFHNLKLISHYVKITKALNEENIFPLIMKGIAMKHIRPDLPRAMGDIDLLIPEDSQINKAREICKNFGYDEEIPDEHSIVINSPNSLEPLIDLHRYIPFETKYNKNFLQDLFSRAKKENVFGTQAFVPCFEDLLFLGMINLARNLNGKTSLGGILYSVFDFKFLSQKESDFNWNLVLQNIIKTKTYAQSLLAMKFINKISPNTLPETLLENSAIHKQFNNYCNRIIFNHFYFNKIKAHGKKLSLKKALRNKKEMRDYFLNKPKYFLLKRVVRKSNFLIKCFLTLKSKNQN